MLRGSAAVLTAARLLWELLPEPSNRLYGSAPAGAIAAAIA